MKEEVEKFARDSLNAYSLDRSCLLGGLGSGIIIIFKERYFIITCRHVVEECISRGKIKITFRGNHKISLKDTALIERTNDDIDISVLEITNGYTPNTFYSEDDINPDLDFGSDISDEDIFLITGYPFELSYKHDDIRRDFKYLSYLTKIYPDKESSKDFLLLCYNIEGDTMLAHSEVSALLPAAPGLSGSGILMPSLVSKENPVWSASTAKLVAVQQSWNKKTMVRCTNISYAINILHKNIK